MKAVHTVLAGVMLCIVMANARHHGDRNAAELSDDRDDQLDVIRKARDHSGSQMRHRRRTWQMNYGYDYPQPPMPYYPDNRREYDNNQQELIPHILRLLDEISAYVKRPQVPPPPPQPIYVPYPVPYLVPQPCRCTNKHTNTKPNVTSRFPDMEDTNQNWGFADNKDDSEDDEGDGSRPISFQPIVPKQLSKRPQPNVEHGSSQAGAPLNGPSESSMQGRAPALGTCEVFSLSCCSGTPTQQRQCFEKYGCASTYDNGRGCNQDRLLSIIDAYSKAYSPVN